MSRSAEISSFSGLEPLPFAEFTTKGDYVEADLELEQQFKLMLAYTYHYNADAVKTRSGMGDYMYNDTGLFQSDITTHFVDVVAKYKGLCSPSWLPA